MDDPRLSLAVKKYADRCLKFDLNATVAIVGEPGSGKSSLAVRIGELLNEKYGFKFDADHIFFDLVEFLESTHEKNSVLIVDEAGVQLFSRNFMTDINKIISYITQTYRFKNSVVILTQPHLRFLDKVARTMISHIWRTEAIVTKGGEAIRVATAYRAKTNFVSDNITIDVDTFTNDRGGVVMMKNITWDLPSEGIWREYLRKKEKYWDAWRKKWAKDLRKALGIKENNRKNVYTAVKEALEQHPEWEDVLFSPTSWSQERARVINKIAQHYGYHPNTIRRAIKNIKQGAIEMNKLLSP